MLGDQDTSFKIAGRSPSRNSPGHEEDRRELAPLFDQRVRYSWNCMVGLRLLGDWDLSEFGSDGVVWFSIVAPRNHPYQPGNGSTVTPKGNSTLFWA